MDRKSSLIQDLRKSGDPGVRYSIIAGDVRKYDESQDAWTSRLLTKLGKGFVFSKVFGDVGHDIAAQVDSIHEIKDDRNPPPFKQSAICHHKNYFVADEALAALAKIDW
jgi:hypothetical protein